MRSADAVTAPHTRPLAALVFCVFVCCFFVCQLLLVCEERKALPKVSGVGRERDRNTDIAVFVSSFSVANTISNAPVASQAYILKETFPFWATVLGCFSYCSCFILSSMHASCAELDRAADPQRRSVGFPDMFAFQKSGAHAQYSM